MAEKYYFEKEEDDTGIVYATAGTIDSLGQELSSMDDLKAHFEERFDSLEPGMKNLYAKLVADVYDSH